MFVSLSGSSLFDWKSWSGDGFCGILRLWAWIRRVESTGITSRWDGSLLKCAGVSGFCGFWIDSVVCWACWFFLGIGSLMEWAGGCCWEQSVWFSLIGVVFYLYCVLLKCTGGWFGKRRAVPFKFSDFPDLVMLPSAKRHRLVSWNEESLFSARLVSWFVLFWFDCPILKCAWWVMWIEGHHPPPKKKPTCLLSWIVLFWLSFPMC